MAAVPSVFSKPDPDSNPYICIPAAYIKNLNNPAVAWQFHSEAATGSGGREIYIPQGKVLGGSTSINGLVYNRGQADDFDRWAELGAKRDLMRCFPVTGSRRLLYRFTQLLTGENGSSGCY